MTHGFSGGCDVETLRLSAARIKQWRTAWDRFAADEANLIEFLNAKRERR